MIENDQEALEALKSLTPTDITKSVVGLAVGAGTARIVHSIIANNVPTPDKTLSKVNLALASAFVGMMAKDATKAYTKTKIDEYATQMKSFREKFNKDKKTTEPDTSTPDPQ